MYIFIRIFLYYVFLNIKYYFPFRNTSTNSDLYKHIPIYIHKFYNPTSKTFIRSHTDFLYA